MKANLEYPITLSTSMPSSSECSPYFFIVGCKKHSKAHSESVLSWYGRMPYVDSYYRIKDNLEEYSSESMAFKYFRGKDI